MGKRVRVQTVRSYLSIPDQLHDITLYADSKTTGCKDTLFKPGYITVYPEPKAGFKINQKLLSNENPVAILPISQVPTTTCGSSMMD